MCVDGTNPGQRGGTNARIPFSANYRSLSVMMGGRLAQRFSDLGPIWACIENENENEMEIME